MLRLQQTYYEGYLWAPHEEEQRLMQSLQELTQQQANIVGGQIQPSRPPVGRDPPTLIKTTEFTWPMQEIVNTYGIPRYGEINPGFFTVCSFPFLFGVMFGDVAHGFAIFLAGNSSLLRQLTQIRCNSL